MSQRESVVGCGVRWGHVDNSGRAYVLLKQAAQQKVVELEMEVVDLTPTQYYKELKCGAVDVCAIAQNCEGVHDLETA